MAKGSSPAKMPSRSATRFPSSPVAPTLAAPARLASLDDPAPPRGLNRRPARPDQPYREPDPASRGPRLGKETCMRILSILAGLTVLLAAPQVRAADVEELCSRATMTAAAGSVAAETFRYGGTDRFVCVYTPAGLPDGDRHPLVIALHGGSGNASQMMEDNHGIIAAAEANGWIAVFPNGLPRPGCDGLPCLDNHWVAPDNVFFIAELVDRQLASGHGAGRPDPPRRLLGRRVARLRHRRDPRLSARGQLDRHRRRRARAVPRRPSRGRVRRDPAAGGRAGQRAARPGRARRPAPGGRRPRRDRPRERTSRSAPRSTTGG